jgi:hypothetical protein
VTAFVKLVTAFVKLVTAFVKLVTAPIQVDERVLVLHDCIRLAMRAPIQRDE